MKIIKEILAFIKKYATVAMIKKYWTFLVMAILVISLFIKNRRVAELEDVNQIQSIRLSVLNDSISTFEDKNGELTFKISSTQIENDNLKQSLEIVGFDLKKLKEKDIAWRNITSSLKLKLEAVGQATTIILDTFYITNTETELDTVYVSAFSWSNNYLSLAGNLKEELLSFDYQYKTDIDILQEKKRNGTMVSVYMTDPNSYITSGNSIIVTNPKKWWEKPWVWGVAGVTTGILISK